MAETLRGNPSAIAATIPKKMPKYGNRPDGTPKGIGFFGEIARTDEPDVFSTELSASFEVDGKQVHIPLLVPALSAEEIAHLVDGGRPTKTIVEKAWSFAQDRIKQGKSPFAELGEQVPLPKTATSQMERGFSGE